MVEEMIAKEFAVIVKEVIADRLRPLQERIAELERSNIERGAEIKLLKGLLLSNRDDEKGLSTVETPAPPWRPAPKVSSGSRRSIKLGH